MSSSSTSVSQPPAFKYDSLTNSDGKHRIRLLRLILVEPDDDKGNEAVQCTMETFTIDQAPEYFGLSYCWGDPKHTVLIQLNSSPFPVTVNLDAALRKIGFSVGERYLWVDAICINQKNKHEKLEQVKIMGQIYQKAWATLAWLGPSGEHTGAAIKFINHMATSEIPKSGPDRSTEEDLTCFVSLWLTLFADEVTTAIKGFVDLMTREFWTRIWIIQEVVLPQRVFVLCGSDFTQWGHLNKISRILGGQAIIQRYPAANVDQGLFQCINSLRMFFPRGVMDLSLSDLVPSHPRSQATHPHDKIYALMGMTSNDPVRERLVLDYDAPVEQLYSEYFKEACNLDGNLFQLCLAGISFRSAFNIPTFVPDWTRVGQSPAYPMLSKFWLGNPGLHPADLHFHVDLTVEWSAASSMKPRGKYINNGSALLIAGIKLDEIKTVGAVATEIGKEESTENLREILNDWGLTMLRIFGSKQMLVDGKDAPVSIQDVADRWYEIASHKISTEETPLNLKQMSKSLSEIEADDKKQGEFPPAGDYKYPPTGESILEAYVRTLVTDRVSAFETSGDEFANRFWNHETKPWNGVAGELDPYFVKLTRARTIQRGRRLVITESRLIGLCPAETKAKDIMCVLYGCPVPMVLRPQDNGYVLVGECYVHGLMKGKAVEIFQEAQTEGKVAELWENGLAVEEREFELH